MDRRRQYVEDIERLRREAKALLDAHPGELPDDVRGQIDHHIAQIEQLETKLRQLEADEQRRRQLAEVDRFLSEPQYKFPRGMLEDPREARQHLLKAGWDCKNGIIYAPTSSGHLYPMWQEEVLFGAVPEDDADAREFVLKTRAAFQPEYEPAFRRWLALCARNRSETAAMLRLSDVERKALSEATDTAGGVLVPPQIQAELLMRKAQQAVVRRLVGTERVVQTSRDRVVYPVLAAHPTQGSIFSSGFVGSWVGETPTQADIDPAFGQLEVPLRKIRAITRLSNDLIADAAANVLSLLATNGARNMALVEDQGFLTGLGTAMQPQGILSSADIPTVDVEGSTANTISNTTTNAGSAPKIIDLAYALPSQYAQNAAFLVRRAIEGKIRKLVDAQNRYLWPPMAGSGLGAAPRDLLGYPIYNCEFMPNDGVDGNKVMLFGDFSGYVICDRAQVTVVVLRERFADTDQTGIVLFERVGGAVWNPDAFRVGVV